MASRYLENVKNALDHMSYDFKEVKRDGDESVQYSMEILKAHGIVMSTMDIIVKEKENSIELRSCLESNIPARMRPKIYQWISEMQSKWHFARMYLNEEGELIADYKMTLKRSEASLVFQENVIRMLETVIYVIGQYAVKSFKVIYNTKDVNAKLAVKQVNLNPFEGRDSYGV